MVLFRAPLSLIIAPPADNSRRSSMRGRMVCLSDASFEESQSPKKSQLVVSITGATGFIGRRLVQKLIADDHIVRILTRSRRNAQLVFPGKKKFGPGKDNEKVGVAPVEDKIRESRLRWFAHVKWRPFDGPIRKVDVLDLVYVKKGRDQRFPEIVIAEEEEWSKCIEGSNAVVNLAGMPISTRWSSEVKKEIKQSRIKVTSKVVDLISKLNSSARPSVLISATAIGYYGTSETQVFDETSPSGNDYLAEVCREWETIALEVDKDVRLLLLRIGVVLGRDGGALAKMIPLFKSFAGGPLGSGKQWFSWIHLDDLVSLIYEALRNPSYKGIVNGTAPHPVRLSEMCDQLGQVMGRPSWLPVPDFVLKAVLGEGATIVLEGQKVLPVKAKELGFTYKYPFVKDAIRDIISSGST